MQFNKASTLELVRRSLSPRERKDISGQELALGMAIDDLATRLRSSQFLRSYDLSVASNKREKTVPGENNDLAHIFALKLGTGDKQRTLEYIDPQSFLRDFDAPDATAGDPNKYTILTYSTDGWPVVKFEVPLDGADTMKVIYWLEVTPETPVPMPAAALVQGTLAYFWGTSSEKGFPTYERFKEAARMERAAADMNPNAQKRFRLSREDRSVLGIQAAIKGRRRP